MKRWLPFLMFILAISSRMELYAAEEKTIGRAAIEGSNQALRLSMFIVGAGLAGTIFGLIYKMASSDPVLFSHCHSCH